MAASYLAVAEWEMRGGTRAAGQPEMARGDWTLAAQYLEKVAQTNAPQRDKAEELLRELRVKEARLAAGL
jgi:anaphase-promoting complex subunit 8